jgi:hypothetical protein
MAGRYVQRLSSVKLATTGLFLFPWRIISEKVNKGPANAMGWFIQPGDYRRFHR